MAGSRKPGGFRSIGEALTELQDLLVDLDASVKRRVLPNQRYGFVRDIRKANTIAEQMRELLTRSGMIERLGFVQNDGACQPVIRQPVNQQDEIAEEGAGLPDGEP